MLAPKVSDLVALSDMRQVLEALKVLAEEEERRAEFDEALARWQARPPVSAATTTGVPPAGMAAPPASVHTEATATKAPVLVPNMLMLGLDDGAYLLKALSSVRAPLTEPALA